MVVAALTELPDGTASDRGVDTVGFRDEEPEVRIADEAETLKKRPARGRDRHIPPARCGQARQAVLEHRQRLEVA